MSEKSDQRQVPLILIVDDEETQRLLERETLEREGFVVEEAEDGMRALAAFDHLRPDMVLLDVLMPDMDGFEVCAEIRTRPDGALTPIIMVTGLQDEASIRRAYDAGATHFITKPINYALLSYEVRYALRGSMTAQELARSERKHVALLDAIPDLFCRIDRNGDFIEVRESKSIPLIGARADLLGKNILGALPPDIGRRAMRYVERAFEARTTQFFEYALTVNDRRLHYEARIVISGEDEVLAIIRDITDRKRAEEQIIRLAYYDSLTGLPNRVLFKDRMRQALSHAARRRTMVATLFLDLDRFKRINDTFGHDMGDLLLKSVAERLTDTLRKSDSVGRPSSDHPEATVARLGGDEFTILLVDMERVEDVARVAWRILGEISKVFPLEGSEVFLNASAGISLYPHDGDDVDTLLKHADAAMCHAKDQGGDTLQFFNDSMNARAYERLMMENSLRKALERQEIEVFYQPQLSLQSGQIVGTEALLRWRHPELGLVSPKDFIPIAEESGLIIPLGEWALRAACMQSVAWRSAGFPPLRMAVNLSGRQLRQNDFARAVSAILSETGIEPACLELELTESIIMKDAETTIGTLEKFKRLGVRLSIDDFGTGYSSLSYLKRFPIDTLKIDRSFVKDLKVGGDDAAITQAIIAMAGSLNLRVVAEGVRTEQQVWFLREQGCHEMQGYFLSPPRPAEEVSHMLTRRPFTFLPPLSVAGGLTAPPPLPVL